MKGTVSTHSVIKYLYSNSEVQNSSSTVSLTSPVRIIESKIQVFNIRSEEIINTLA